MQPLQCRTEIHSGISKDAAPDKAPTNPRGIPFAPFVSSVSDYVSSRAEVESTLRSFQEMISKYQFMEVNTQRRGQGLREKIPDIQKTLETVKFLKHQQESLDGDRHEASKPLEATFELNDTLYAKAHFDAHKLEEVYLWLGANVMLAYPIDESEILLSEKLKAAKTTLGNCEEDLEFLREQITV